MNQITKTHLRRSTLGLRNGQLLRISHMYNSERPTQKCWPVVWPARVLLVFNLNRQWANLPGEGKPREGLHNLVAEVPLSGVEL